MTRVTILLLGSGQAAFLVALIASKKGKTLADAVLATWIAVLGLHHLLSALHYQGIGVVPVMLNLNAGVPLLQGPFLFLYVHLLTSGRRRLRATDALHLLPFVGFAIYASTFAHRSAPTHSSSVSLFELSGWITAAILASVPAYALVSLQLLRRHDAATLDRFSERRGRDLRWLRRIVLALLAVWVIVIFTSLAPPESAPGTRHSLMSAVTLFLYAIGYFGWRQFAVVDSPEFEAVPEISGRNVDSSPKYERSGLKHEEIEDLVGRLETYLERDRPYLEPGVTLAQIAGGLGATSNHLSQAINQGLNKSFHEVINERRVAEFKERAVDLQNRNRTLLAIAFDSGFSSKSSFNRVFKQIAGMSPRQYVAAQRRDSSDQ